MKAPYYFRLFSAASH